METLCLIVNATLLAANGLMFVAAYNKYTHANRLLEETRKIALRVLLIKKRS